MSANTTNNRSHSTTAAEVNQPNFSSTSAATGWSQRSHGRHVARNGMCDCAQDAPGMPSGFVLKHSMSCPLATFDEDRHARARLVLLYRMLFARKVLIDCQGMLDQYPRAFAGGDLLDQLAHLETEVDALRDKVFARASLAEVA